MRTFAGTSRLTVLREEMQAYWHWSGAIDDRRVPQSLGARPPCVDPGEDRKPRYLNTSWRSQNISRRLYKCIEDAIFQIGAYIEPCQVIEGLLTPGGQTSQEEASSGRYSADVPCGCEPNGSLRKSICDILIGIWVVVFDEGLSFLGTLSKWWIH